MPSPERSLLPKFDSCPVLEIFMDGTENTVDAHLPVMTVVVADSTGITLAIATVLGNNDGASEDSCKAEKLSRRPGAGVISI
jgi:hypothetical protein